ncbi:NAC domain [Arabidopsis suecica]|uniref:NAC domain n=1 Tax=Arabidopsis suecica TaxID=45249 RepID=A0A8T2B2A0_ARASU|nr:NAC domain [Arabidopsis suecica]
MGRESLAVVSSPPSATAPSTAVSATSLAPGFRFHPTDEELVSYYLKRKVLGKPVRFDAIGEVDIYKHEPWDLAVFSKLKTRDQEWYFFSALDKKYGNGARMNRATNKGYWKATGKDREIRRDIQLLGMKKTLVFHSGRAPDGLRTNWVMHEYRLVEYETETNGSLLQDAYVLCRVFHKNNIGPPSGNRYAPFMEEEWADGGGALIPGIDVRVRVEALPQANGNKQMDQEIHSTSKDLININELPRDATPMDIEPNQQNHHESAFKPQENNNHSGYEEDEETLKREHAEEDERPPPLSILNKEAPLPLLQYKRRRQNESNNNSSRSTQDHCSSTITTVDNTTTLTSSSSAAAATNTAISALLEFSLMGISEKKENQQKPLSPHKEASPPSPVASPEEKVNDLQKEIHQMSVERETFKLEMMSAEAMISILQSRIDALRQENEELKKKNASGQAS